MNDCPIEVGQITDELKKFHVQFAGESERQDLNIFERDSHRQLIGGLSAYTQWGWLYIRLLWVHESERGRGLGRALIERAQLEAMNRGIHRVWIDTFNPQAKEFYMKLDFQIFGVLKDCPPGWNRFFLAKELSNNFNSPPKN